MKTLSLIVVCLLLAIGCTMNPSKEARIQKLEGEMKEALEKIDEHENIHQTLDSVNHQLRVRILELEK